MSVSEPVPHQVESPSDAFNQSHGVYQHSSGLSFPRIGVTPTSELSQSAVPAAPIESAPTGYMQNSISEGSEAPSLNFTYPQPQTTHKAAPDHAAQPTPVVAHSRSSSSGGQAPASRQGLLTSQPAQHDAMTGTATSTWQSMPAQGASAAKSSPRPSRAKKPAPGPLAYDDLREQQSSWANANQPVAQTTQPMQPSPDQAAAQPVRSKSRQSTRAQSHTPVNSLNSLPPARQAQPHGGQSLADNSGYASASVVQQSSSTQSYNDYNQYSSGNNQADSSGDRIAYQPYTNNPASTHSTSYSSFENYNSRLASAPSSTRSSSASQNVASSYPANSATQPPAAQWGAATSTPQARNAHAYNATQSASGTTSYNVPSSTQQSQSLQGFSVKPQAPTQARSSSSMYSQQPQPQQHRQQPHQQQQQPQRQQQQNYNGYLGNIGQQAHTTSNHQNWYGFGAASNTSSGYNSAAATSGNNAYSAAAATSHAQGHCHGHQTQPHRPMNLSSHTYSSMDGHGEAVYDLLRSNPGG